MALTLKVLSENVSSRKLFTIPPGAGSYRIGRKGDCDFTIDHISVSGLHAKIVASGVNGVELVDCESSNGTFVNGERIERHTLAEGDRIRFASAEIEVFGDLSAAEEEMSSDLEHTAKVSLMPGAEGASSSPSAVQVDPENEAREMQISSLEEQLAETRRELDDSMERADRLRTDLSQSRETILERESQVAALEFEVSRRDGFIEQWEKQNAALTEERDQWQANYEEKTSMLLAKEEELQQSQEEASGLQGRLDSLRERIASLSESLIEDWKEWIDESTLLDEEEEGDGRALKKVERLRESIREQLDLIEPIWSEFGEGVQEELRRRCDALRDEQDDLEKETQEKRDTLDLVSKDLSELREEVDREVRRAQGLSRKGTEIEIPERYESMVIARDREQELYCSLIEKVEFLDRLLEGYRHSRKLKEVVRELNDFRRRLVTILEENGVEEFKWGKGTHLTLKHRKEVQILERKGWGTRDYMELPFQPGEVTKVIRSGYRAGEGSDAVILRKVEVLIREDAG